MEGEVEAGFILHPLIHTLLKFDLAQDVDLCQNQKTNPPDQSSTQGQWGLRVRH